MSAATETIEQPRARAISLRWIISGREDLVWFFLISGPEAQVEKHLQTFDAFVKSAKIDPIE